MDNGQPVNWTTRSVIDRVGDWGSWFGTGKAPQLTARKVLSDSGSCVACVADPQTLPETCLIAAGCSQASRLIVIPKPGSSPISMDPSCGAIGLSSIAGQSRS